MRKLKTLFLLTLLAAVAVLGYKYNLDIKKQQARETAAQLENTSEYEELKAKVDDNAIIRKAFKSVGVIGVLEGNEQYKQIIEDENWFSYRGININWQYKFALAMNLEDIGVEVEEGVVNITIDNKKLFIWYIRKTEDSISHSEASWLAKKFSSQEIETLENIVQEKVQKKIKDTPIYWQQARKSLESNLVKLCNDLGYYRINFIDKEETMKN